MTHPLWPLFDLRLRTSRLELRVPTDGDLVELAAVAKAGIHPPDEMPFAVPWSILPTPAFERGFVQFHWGLRAGWSVEDWSLDLAVFHEGRPIGAQGLYGRAFPILRTVHTGSWLGAPYQRQGFGTEMRSAVLSLAFDGLGAEVAETEAFLDNPASAGVSQRLGYEEDGLGRRAPQGVAREVRRYRLTAERWRTVEHTEVEIIGLEGCRELFGALPRAES
jgi:RimJ/RimL family protein N-acetyltransferase